MALTEPQIRSRLASLAPWSFADNALVREYTFPSFPDAVAFVTRLAFEAEAADHHPDLLLRYKRVRVTWSTHSDGGVTEKDFDGVAHSDRIAARFEGQ